jgi:hypothetical protein
MAAFRITKHNYFAISLLLAYVVFYILWPFYIDLKIAPGVGLNPQRLVSATIAIMVVIIFFLKPTVFSPLATGFKRRKLFFTSLICYFVWRIVTAFSANFSASFSFAIYEILSYLIIFFGFWVFILNTNKINQYLKVLMWITLTLTIIGIAEYMIGSNMFAQFATSDNRIAISSSEILREGGHRVKTTFEHPLTLVQFLAIVLPLMLVSGKHIFNNLTRWLILFCCITLLALTKSRSALIFLIITASYYYFILYISSKGEEKRTRLATVVFFAFIVTATATLLFTMDEDLFGRSLFESTARMAQLLNGLVAITESPYFGYGPGLRAGELVYDIASSSRSAAQMWESNASTVDNRFLSIALESGLPALILFLTFSLYALINSHNLLIQAGRMGIKGHHWRLLLGSSLSCIGTLTTMMILSIFTVHSLYFISLSIVVYTSIRIQDDIKKTRKYS